MRPDSALAPQAVRLSIVQRLRSSGDVRAVFAARAVAACRHAVVHARRRDDAGPARVTVVAGKRVGNAVARNRAKRRLRELVRATALRDGTDYVVVARPAAVRAPDRELASSIAEIFQKMEAREAR